MRNQVIELLQRTLPKHEIADSLDAQADLMDEVGVDSLDLLNVATAMEKEFGVAVADHEWRELRSVQSIVDIIAQRQLAKN
jgi:acyl carrier protein